MKSSARAQLNKRAALDRGKSSSKPKSPSDVPKVKTQAGAVAADGHRDSAEFFEKYHGGLLSPPPALSSSEFPLFPADDATHSLTSVNAAAPVFTPQKIEAKRAGHSSKLLKPSPNVSLFKRNERIDIASDALPRVLSQPAVDAGLRAVDLASSLQFGPGKPVPAPPSPPHHVKDQSGVLPSSAASDSEFHQIQHFLASRLHSAA